MGKGSRNRIGRDEDILVKNPKKSKKRRVHRPLPKWVVPAIAGVVAVAIAVGAIVLVLMNNGTFKRTNILVKSQKDSKYSINQQAAQVLIWTSIWDQASNIYGYYSGLADSEFEYCWGQAMTAKYNIHEYIGDYYAQTFTSLVAYCDEGIIAGVEFTKEEQDAAYEKMINALKSEAYDYYSHLSSEGVSNISPYYVYYASYPYFGQYLKTTLGNDIKEKDIRRAAIIQAYADKVYSLKQNEFWETTAENVAAEVNANPENYYTVDYLTYSAEDAALAAVLGSTKTADAFKTAIVSDYVKNNYFNLYNKYVTKALAQVNETLDAVSGVTTKEDLDTVLTAQGMKDSENDYTAETAEGELTGDLHVIAHWLFPEEEGAEPRAQFDATTLTTADGLKVYVVVVSDVDTETGTVTAAYKEFTYEKLSDDDLAKLTNTVAKSLEIPIAEDAAVYESASEKADAIVKALNAENADKDAIYLANGAVTVNGVTEASDTLLSVIRDAVFAGNVKSGDVLKVGTYTTVYVVSVNEFTPAVEANEEAGTEAVAASANVCYITVEEPMDEVVVGLTDNLESKIPSESSASFKKSVAAKYAKHLEALNAAEDKAKYLLYEGASAVENMTSENYTEKISSDAAEISAAVLAENVAAGSILTVDKPNSTTKYLIYVTARDENGVTFNYLTVSSYEAGSYEEWLFGSVDLATMTGNPAVGTTFTKGNDVYLATSGLKKDTEKVVRGGYVSFSSEAEANEALKSLSGLQGYQLLKALAELNSDAVTSNKIQESSVEGELKSWFFSDTRAANDAAVVTVTTDDEGETSTAYYVAVFVQGMEAWESTARTNYASEAVGDWIDGVISERGYAISEKALKRIKNPKMPKSDEEESGDESQEDSVTE